MGSSLGPCRRVGADGGQSQGNSTVNSRPLYLLERSQRWMVQMHSERSRGGNGSQILEKVRRCSQGPRA